MYMVISVLFVDIYCKILIMHMQGEALCVITILIGCLDHSKCVIHIGCFRIMQQIIAMLSARCTYVRNTSHEALNNPVVPDQQPFVIYIAIHGHPWSYHRALQLYCVTYTWHSVYNNIYTDADFIACLPYVKNSACCHAVVMI